MITLFIYNALGNAYVCGRTQGSNFPILNAFQPTYGGGGLDSFVTKLDPTGGIVYSTYLGGSADDEDCGVATDSLGNTYVAGQTNSANFPPVNALYPSFRGGPWDAYVAKFDSVGGVIYSTYLGGSGDDGGRGVASDSSGNAYVIGYTRSSDFPIQNALQNTPHGDSEAFITKVNPDGSSILFSTYFGGSGNDGIGGIRLDSSGYIYVGGATGSLDFPTKNPFQPNLRGSSDQWVAKLTPDGSTLVFSTYLGGSGDDGGRGLALDSSGNVYVSGDTSSADFPMVNPIQAIYAGGSLDTFIAKLRSDGSTLMWSTYLGGSNFDVHAGIGVDASDNLYVAMRTQSTNLPTVNALQPAHAGGEMDAFLAKIACSPTLGTISAPVSPVQVSTLVVTSAPFTDPDVLDSHTAQWDWGDGTTSAGIVTETNGFGSVTGSHNYAVAGVYTVTLTLTDNDGCSAQSVFQFVVVYDPNAGFVTGGGWIDSPAGAYAANTSLTGKANFGFVSKYQKGANVPTGVTEFQFKVADLNFHSNNYEWLVVGGPRAQYKGTGTINGAGSYKFILTAIDGQVPGGGGIDKFRIKIGESVSGVVIYDNQTGASDDANPTTQLGGGSIVIHTN